MVPAKHAVRALGDGGSKREMALNSRGMSAGEPERGAELRRFWGRYLDLDAPVNDLLTELDHRMVAWPEMPWKLTLRVTA